MTTGGRKYRDEDWLREQYHDKEKTTREIGDEIDCSSRTVSRWLKIHGIESRENWKAGVEAAKRANRIERVKMRTLDGERGYEYWGHKVWEDGKRVMKIVYVHRLLAVAEHGFDAVKDKDVHHKKPIPWLNTPDNIQVVDRREHASYHSNRIWGDVSQTHGEVVTND